VAQKDKDKDKARRGRAVTEPGHLTFGTRNYMALGAALACILIGFGLLARGSITAAPILLVLGYCVLVPYGLAAGRESADTGE
jgi:hypothetical protein